MSIKQLLILGGIIVLLSFEQVLGLPVLASYLCLSLQLPLKIWPQILVLLFFAFLISLFYGQLFSLMAILIILSAGLLNRTQKQLGLELRLKVLFSVSLICMGLLVFIYDHATIWTYIYSGLVWLGLLFWSLFKKRRKLAYKVGLSLQ